MSVISVTYSMCLVYKITIVRRLDFSDSKAIVHSQREGGREGEREGREGVYVFLTCC